MATIQAIKQALKDKISVKEAVIKVRQAQARELLEA
jgi:hypothetical protein